MNKIKIKEYKAKLKTKAKESKFTKLCVKLRKFVMSESDYMIFLIMLLSISAMYESYGYTKTLPLVLIVPFFLGTFYKGRKRIMLHTVIAMIVLASVSQDVEYSARVILVGTVCTFTGLLVSKYIDHFKRYKWYRKVFSGVVTFVFLIFAFSIYTFQYGSPSGLYEAQKNVLNSFSEKEKKQMVCMGAFYNYEYKTYDVDFLLKEDYKTEVTYHYFSANKKIYSDEELQMYIEKINVENNNQNDEVNEIENSSDENLEENIN